MVSVKEKEDLDTFESFLESLKLHPELFHIRNFELDLLGKLNPGFYLNKLYFEQGLRLNFEEFFLYYTNQFKNIIKEEFNLHDEEKLFNGLKARLYRTQFGFLTEYHAFYLAACLFGNKNVTRSPHLDAAGVDFRVLLDRKVYNIHVFVDTARAWEFRQIKSQFKKGEKLQGIHVNLPYSLQKNRFNSLRYLKNRFGVFTESYLRYFADEASAGRIKNNNITGTKKTGFIYSA